MIYPAQTSLIPIQVALARFLESLGGLGINAFNQNYPYWYLGTTPFRYLTGPILPGVLALLHRFLPNFSLFEIMLGVIGVCWMVGGLGVYLLVKTLMDANDKNANKSEWAALLSAVFYLFGPIVPFLFRFSDGLYLIAFSFLPFVLLLYLKLLKNWSRKLALFCMLAISFIILLDTLILPSLFLGMAAVFLATAGWKGTEEKLKKSLVLGAWCLVLVTLWYTPGYWWTLLGAPSFGGKGLGMVIVWLGKLLPTVLAFGIAIVSVKFFKKRNLLRDFCFYWLFIFGFLTLVRFLSDPDFWLDWTAYSTELQLGFAVLGGLVVKRLALMRIVVFVVCCMLFVVWLFIANKYLLGTLQQDITRTVEYRIGKYLSQTANPSTSSGQRPRVFLSGTTAFWLNAFFDIPQVRGGRDQVAVDPTWRQAVWEIRQGESANDAENVLKALKISYLVVHTPDSEEFYHDFAYPEKFEDDPGLVKVYEGKGDRIYRVEASN